MSRTLLAIDVGGSTSRASLVDETGRCLGHGRSRGGNPASNTPELAAAAIVAAVEAAVAEAGPGPFDIAIALLALAGPQKHVALTRLEEAFRRLGLGGPIVFRGDVQAMFTSVTLAMDGYCLIAGTGSGVVRLRAGEIDRVVDLAGWLLGDLGSGYWLGHEAAKAVVAEMEGRGAATALTPLLLDALEIRNAEGRMQGRPMLLRQFIDGVYALRPIELAKFAPLVVANPTDPVAARLIAQAERYLVDDFALAFDPSHPGPVVLGGGVVAHLPGVTTGIAEIIRKAGHEPDIRLAGDGSVGAIVLALRAVGIDVDETMFQRIVASVAERTSRPGS
jgi:N-acetylglucosamine kinase-like BadF-type ATPase